MVLNLNDIEVSLNNIALLDDLANVRAEDLARAEEAFRIAQVRYREGAANYEDHRTLPGALQSQAD